MEVELIPVARVVLALCVGVLSSVAGAAPVGARAPQLRAQQAAPSPKTSQALGGDFNGDGYGDLLAGQAFNGPPGGAFAVVPGSARGLDRTAEKTISEATPGVPGAAEPDDGFGGSLAIGDFNRDGYSDVLVGSSGESIGTVSHAGMVTVLYGGPQGLPGQHARSFSQNSAGVPGTAEANDEFGMTTVAADFNGDGYDDAAIAAPWETFGKTTSRNGMVIILYGSKSGLTAQHAAAFDHHTKGMTDTKNSYGGSWAYLGEMAAGDFDGDGRDDLAIGVDSARQDRTYGGGFVQVIYGTSHGLSSSRARRLSASSPGVPGNTCRCGFGNRTTSGDYNGDGRDDIVVDNADVIALYGSSAGLTGRGSAKVAGGPNDCCVSALRTGDVNEDGFADLLSNGGNGNLAVLRGSRNGLSDKPQEVPLPDQARADCTTDSGSRLVSDAAVIRASGLHHPATVAATDASDLGEHCATGKVYFFTNTNSGLMPAGDMGSGSRPLQ